MSGNAPTEIYASKSLAVLAVVFLALLSALMVVGSLAAPGYVRLEGIVRMRAAYLFGVLAVICLAKDAGVALDRITGSPMSLGYFVDSRDDVDRVLEHVQAAGGTIFRAPLERPWGIYAGYFADPDAHLWEVVYFLHGRPN